ncbi:ImmA/IrrE family metallo-endopeptidase [Rhodococcus pseudokoreensis]|uniref:ImmA/IrrE family metallo-endopeptidase n=1 Tax=Rhodococcus pseudokoreensis TaxID=2811421 RepID=A0A974W3C3_9NOCA|nr:ImmA/IrrE family metallo-endopeptidase [Rhodococcus pseudokoreensis]QSE89553.1 ImmA/IrrE family metallo-endopeptidase [Rhodococcus pseudokoreensis]
MGANRSHRRVAAAVDAVCDAAARAEAVTLRHVVDAVARERQRSIELDFTKPMAPGVCGQRRAYPDRDVIVLAPGLPDLDRTLAHELGHIVFRHEGAEIVAATLEAGDDLIAYMLSQRSRRRGEEQPSDEVAEWEAETFASMLLIRLKTMQGRGTPVSVLRYDEAIG